MKGYRISKEGFVIPGWIEEDDVRKLPDDFIEFPLPLANMDKYRYKVIGDNCSVIQKIIEYQEELSVIAEFKELLNSTDYKVTKCMEAQLLGISLPYNITELHTQRQQIRDRINELETIISKKNNENRL